MTGKNTISFEVRENYTYKNGEMLEKELRQILDKEGWKENFDSYKTSVVTSYRKWWNQQQDAKQGKEEEGDGKSKMDTDN